LGNGKMLTLTRQHPTKRKERNKKKTGGKVSLDISRKCGWLGRMKGRWGNLKITICQKQGGKGGGSVPGGQENYEPTKATTKRFLGDRKKQPPGGKKKKGGEGLPTSD